jgi:pilus assembly protein CpaB
MGIEMTQARGPGAQNAERDMILTVSLNVPEAQLLALAVEKGRISVAVRNPDDVRTTEGLSDLSSTALLNEQQRRAVQVIRQSPAAPIRLPTQERP